MAICYAFKYPQFYEMLLQAINKCKVYTDMRLVVIP
jgi:hypothetical protein